MITVRLKTPAWESFKSTLSIITLSFYTTLGVNVSLLLLNQLIFSFI